MPLSSQRARIEAGGIKYFGLSGSRADGSGQRAAGSGSFALDDGEDDDLVDSRQFIGLPEDTGPFLALGPDARLCRRRTADGMRGRED